IVGLDVNPFAVEFCNSKGMRAFVIEEDGGFPLASHSSDVCILDNVLEHIEEPKRVLDECDRVTRDQGGLVVAVPGVRGYDSDPDHKLFYDEVRLQQLDDRWRRMWSFSIPFLFKSHSLSRSIKQYCLVAVYKKVRSGSLSQ
ncbi:MAG: methyltransferase domain-containing protein, partial [Acidobacteriaceae bacterium]